MRYNHALLKTLRLAKEMTQDSAAQAIDYCSESVSRAERGVGAGWALLHKLANLYGVPVSSLLEAPEIADDNERKQDMD